MRSFWFHYNRPATQQAGVPMMTVHHAGVCHLVSRVVCRVPVSSKVRSRQPRVVMAGRGCVRVRDGVATITEV